MLQGFLEGLPIGKQGRDLVRAHQFWIYLGLVVAVVAASFAVPYTVSSRRNLLLMIGMILGLGGILVLLRWPPLGLVLLGFSGMITPWLGFGGLNTSMLLVGLMLGLWVLEMITQQGQITLIPSRTRRPLLAMVVVSIIAFALGQFSWFAYAGSAPLQAQVGGLALFILSAGAFILAAHQIKSLRWLQAITWVYLAAAAVYIIFRLVPALPARAIFRSGAFDALFWAWVPAMAFSQALVNRKLRPEWRGALLLLVAAVLFVALTQAVRWKSGWVPTVMGLGAIIGIYSWRAGLLLAVLGGLSLIPLGPTLLDSDSYSLFTRLDAWLILLNIIQVSPVLGLGFGNYRFYTPLYRIRGWSVQFNSHNNYLDIVAQTGLVGLGCFLWLFAEVIALGWRLREKVPEGFSRAYVYGVLGGTVSTLVAGMLGDWVIPFTYNVGLNGFRTTVMAWVFLGGLVALENLYDNDRLQN